MKFRVKYITNLGYFGQVKKLFFWYTIGAHLDGFGLYPNNHTRFPLETEQEAKSRCLDYFKWNEIINSKPIFGRFMAIDSLPSEDY